MDELTIQEILFKYRWYILGISIGIILVILGFVSMTRQLPFFESDKIEILSSNDTSGTNVSIKVEISGSVEKPGVYDFNSGSRVDDLLIKAGGLSAAADRDWVAKTLNRAAKLTDGQKIFIPEKSTISITSTKSIKGNNTDNISGLININNASLAELDKLPGIGPATAQKIIDNRPYSAVEELITRKILKQKVYEDIRNKLSVY